MVVIIHLIWDAKETKERELLWRMVQKPFVVTATAEEL